MSTAILGSCQNRGKAVNTSDAAPVSAQTQSSDSHNSTALTDETYASYDSLTYARGIAIKHCPNYVQVDIRNPWDTLKKLNTYLLINRDRPIPRDLPKGTVVKVPIRNAVVYTSVHSAILEQLGSLDAIAGVCEPQYITSKEILRLVRAGKIADIGEATSPNIEKIIDIGAEIIICSPYENGGYGSAEKLGIPIIDAADYMENHPLARTEWVKFYGLLSGHPEKADSIFHQTAQNYHRLKTLVTTHVAPLQTTSNASLRSSDQTPAPRPTLLTERKYGSGWFVPGGSSYTAIMYSDAGADYIFRENPTVGNAPVSPETVLEKAIHADIWIMKYAMDRPMTYTDLAAEYELYTRFDPYKRHRIYTCNTLLTPYYDDITMHPDLILADLIHIFHPALLPDHTPRYFLPMAE